MLVLFNVVVCGVRRVDVRWIFFVIFFVFSCCRYDVRV